jgi:hypothetical protein
MPSTSAKQHRFMEAIAHNSAFAKKAGVPQSVGKDFSAADKGKKFAGGGAARQKINQQDTQHGAMDMPFKSLKKFTGMKAGGKVRRFEEGGLSYEQTQWLGKADQTDPIIMARMRAAVPDSTARSSGGEPDIDTTRTKTPTPTTSTSVTSTLYHAISYYIIL